MEALLFQLKKGQPPFSLPKVNRSTGQQGVFNLGSADKCYGHRNKKHKKTAFWRRQCFAPVVSAVPCLISSKGLNQPHHNTNAALLRGRWHRQKDKNRSPSAKNQYFRNQFIRKRKLKLHHNVGTCLWHVSMQTAIDQYISNKPKEPSLWFVWFARKYFIIRDFSP